MPEPFAAVFTVRQSRHLGRKSAPDRLRPLPDEEPVDRTAQPTLTTGLIERFGSVAPVHILGMERRPKTSGEVKKFQKLVTKYGWEQVCPSNRASSAQLSG